MKSEKRFPKLTEERKYDDKLHLKQIHGSSSDSPTQTSITERKKLKKTHSLSLFSKSFARAAAGFDSTVDQPETQYHHP